MRVQILERSDDLHNVALDLKLVKSLSSSDELVECLVGTELKEDVHALVILKEVLEPNDVCVVQRSMNLDFRHELLLCSTFSERGFSNYFRCRHSFTVEIGEFIALSEPSFTQEPASLILFNIDVSIVLDDLLLNNDLLLIHWVF